MRKGQRTRLRIRLFVLYSMINLNHICSQLGLDPLAAGLQIVDARELAGEFFPRLDTDRPTLIAKVASLKLAREVRRTLLINYPATHLVSIVSGDHLRERDLGSLTREKEFTDETVMYVPPLPEPSSPQSLAAIVARLRAPKGCPWDREQTHSSLRRALLEETYEVIEALDENDPAKLQEELGDLFLHILFQTQIARDESEFTLADVGAQLAAKLIRRHPHVFGNVQVKSAEDVVHNWEKIKEEEKRHRRRDDLSGRLQPSGHFLDADIPRDLPALVRAQKIYKRAKRAGAGSNVNGLAEPVVDKIKRGRDRERVLGELLFALASVAEENDLDAESALRQASAQVVERAAEK